MFQNWKAAIDEYGVNKNGANNSERKKWRGVLPQRRFEIALKIKKKLACVNGS